MCIKFFLRRKRGSTCTVRKAPLKVLVQAEENRTLLAPAPVVVHCNKIKQQKMEERPRRQEVCVHDDKKRGAEVKVLFCKREKERDVMICS